MVRVFKWLAAATSALLLVVLSVYLASRAMRPSSVEQEAVALVDAAPAREGADGFADLYTVARDVPASERGPLLAGDVRRYTARSLAVDGSGTPSWRSALQDWPELGQRNTGDPAWCPLREPGCLARIRAAPQDYAGLLERNTALLERAAALSAWDHFASPFAPGPDTPLPGYQALTHLPTRHAWRFVQGETDAGLAGACASVAQARKLITSGDNFVGSMIGAALVQGNATLLADMLAELPRDHMLPAECGAAFVLPLPGQGGVCGAMLGEARFIAGAYRSPATGALAGVVAGKELPRGMSRLIFDPERTVARMAPRFAWYCGEQARGLLAQDKPLVDTSPVPGPWSLQCVSNAAGCILADIAQPAYSGYGLRLQDTDARLRLMAALLWLRAQPGAIDATTPERLPASLQSMARPMRIDPGPRTLGIALYEQPGQYGTRQDGSWSVPLPASRLQPAGASPRAGRR